MPGWMHLSSAPPLIRFRVSHWFSRFNFDFDSFLFHFDFVSLIGSVSHVRVSFDFVSLIVVCKYKSPGHSLDTLMTWVIKVLFESTPQANPTTDVGRMIRSCLPSVAYSNIRKSTTMLFIGWWPGLDQSKGFEWGEEGLCMEASSRVRWCFEGCTPTRLAQSYKGVQIHVTSILVNMFLPI